MRITSYTVGLIAGGVLAASSALADTPQLGTKHGHANQVSGKVTMLRAQEKGLEIQANGEKVEAEIIVQLDAQPNMVFTLPFHTEDPARREMVETLRQAYMNDKPITIEHKIAPGKKTAQINWVQLGELNVEQ